LPTVVVTENWKDNLKIFVRKPLSAIGIPIQTEGATRSWKNITEMERAKLSLDSSK
jgi:hypothetical protein